MGSPSLFRLLPSTDKLLQSISDVSTSSHTLSAEQKCLLSSTPRPLLRDLVNDFLSLLRKGIKDATIGKDELEFDTILSLALSFLSQKAQPHFRRVLNATGVVIHTNMGRSLLADEAIHAVQNVCQNYSNLELDLASGERGTRYSHVEKLLCKLTGAEAALVVNNNAAAVFITLDALCKDKEVIVSRGELVEIGGSFRIPEVMEKSGCILKEVGATNRTHLFDYEKSINENTAALMKVHSSNYRIIGYTSAPDREALATLAHAHSLPAIEDLGSGSLCNFTALGFSGVFAEPTIQEVVASGVDVVTCSGDKVLGGPQAGIILGKKKYIDKIKQNPLNRALRIDKMTLAALEATLRIYTDIELAKQHIPTLRMIFTQKEELKKKAKKLQRLLRKTKRLEKKVSIIQGFSRIGGGSFPECDLSTFLVAIASDNPNHLKKKLLEAPLPLIGRIEQDCFCLDPRTLREDELSLVADAICHATA